MQEEKEKCETEQKSYRVTRWEEMTIEQKQAELMKELLRTQRMVERIGVWLNYLVYHDHKDGKLVTSLPHPSGRYEGFYFKVCDNF